MKLGPLCTLLLATLLLPLVAYGQSTIDNLYPVKQFPLPDAALVPQNLWMTQGGIDYRINPLQLGYIYQGNTPPANPFINQLWWDTSVTPAALRTWQSGVGGGSSSWQAAGGAAAGTTPQVAWYAQNGATVAPNQFVSIPNNTLVVNHNILGTALPSLPSGWGGAGLRLIGSASQNDANVLIDSFNGTGTYDFRRANGTMEAQTGLNPNDPIGFISARGATGSGYAASSSARIAFFADTPWSPASTPAYISIQQTLPNANTAPIEVGRWQNAGLSIGNPPMAGQGQGTLAMTGTLTINLPGAASPIPPLPSDFSGIASHVIGAGGTPAMLVDGFNGAVALTFRRANGSPSTPTAVLNNDVIGVISMRGYAGNTYNNYPSARVAAFADGNWSLSPPNAAAYLSFEQTLPGTATRSVQTMLLQNGGLSIGNPPVSPVPSPGTLTLNHNTSSNFANLPDPVANPAVLRTIGSSYASAPAGSVDLQEIAFGTSGSIQVWRANGTMDAPSTLNDQDILASFNARGFLPTGSWDTSVAARLLVRADGNWVSNNTAAMWQFAQRLPNTGGAAIPVVNIQNGGLAIGNPPPPSQGPGTLIVSRQNSTNIPPLPPGLATAVVRLLSGNDVPGAATGAVLHDSFGAAAPSHIFRYTAGSMGSPTYPTAEQNIGNIGWQAYLPGIAYAGGAVARLAVTSEPGWSTANYGTYVKWGMTLPNTTTLVDQFYIRNGGVVVAGATGNLPACGTGCTSGSMGPGTVNVASNVYVNGNPIGGTAGVGTVNSGASGQLAYYAAAGSAVSGLTVGTGLTIVGGQLNATAGSALVNPGLQYQVAYYPSNGSAVQGSSIVSFPLPAAGALTVNLNTAGLPTPPPQFAGTIMHLGGANDVGNNTSVVVQDSWGSGPWYAFRRANNTIGSVSNLNGCDPMGNFLWYGTAPGGYVGQWAAAFGVTADGAWTSSGSPINQGAYFTWSGTPNGQPATSEAEWMRLQSGGLAVGTSSNGAGTINTSGTITAAQGFNATGNIGATSMSIEGTGAISSNYAVWVPNGIFTGSGLTTPNVVGTNGVGAPQYNYNPSGGGSIPGVNCAANTVNLSTLVVQGGIVTHC